MFWKTGFHNDWDKVTVANVKITGEDVKGLLADYVDESEIIKDYLIALKLICSGMKNINNIGCHLVCHGGN